MSMNSNAVEDWSKQKYFCLLFVFYLVAHGGILFIPAAIYWDDWTLYQVSPEYVLENFRLLGSVLNVIGHAHNTFLSYGPGLYRVMTFVFMFGAAVALDNILSKHESITSECRLFIVLLFLALPFYWARVALIDIIYTLCYFLFFLAWATMHRWRIFSLFLFCLSFNTNSLLVFYALPFFENYLRSSSRDLSIKSFLFFSARKLDYVILPFAFFAVKIFLYPPSGVFAGYNQDFRLVKLFESPIVMILEWSGLEVSVFLFACFGILIYTALRVFVKFSGKQPAADASWLLFAGLTAFLLAGFPYWVLGAVPTFSEWSSRHQLLFPLGVSLIVTSLLVVLGAQIRRVMLSIFLSISIALNVSTYIDFYFDWQKQKCLIMILGQNDLIRDADVVVFNDTTLSLNAVKRTFRAYEWNGLLATSFGDESRLGLSQSEIERVRLGTYFDEHFADRPKHRRDSEFHLRPNLETVLVTIRLRQSRLKSLFSNDPLIKIDVSTLPAISILPADS